MGGEHEIRPGHRHLRRLLAHRDGTGALTQLEPMRSLKGSRMRNSLLDLKSGAVRGTDRAHPTEPSPYPRKTRRYGVLPSTGSDPSPRPFGQGLSWSAIPAALALADNPFRDAAQHRGNLRRPFFRLDQGRPRSESPSHPEGEETFRRQSPIPPLNRHPRTPETRRPRPVARRPRSDQLDPPGQTPRGLAVTPQVSAAARCQPGFFHVVPRASSGPWARRAAPDYARSFLGFSRCCRTFCGISRGLPDPAFSRPHDAPLSVAGPARLTNPGNEVAQHYCCATLLL